ncbi:hypothetical protein CEXT_256331 [Caerostris extrusa]|uniref:Uncharacterized protein n=1 Tax=Caerostris extrusa TaxID=172846 RepID=A0AAV4M6C9_CAEEX|nr:hypothetical protein CEXT_256331 [Caerostris extrusa]
MYVNISAPRALKNLISRLTYLFVDKNIGKRTFIPEVTLRGLLSLSPSMRFVLSSIVFSMHLGDHCGIRRTISGEFRYSTTAELSSSSSSW